MSHLTPQQLATRWRVSTRTLARMRVEGRGPAYFKTAGTPQGHVRYALDDVEAWEASSRQTNTAQRLTPIQHLDFEDVV